METLRRLRFLWALICLATAALAMFVFFSQGTAVGLPFGFIALVLGFTPYMSAGWFTKFSVAWLVSGTVLSLVAGAGTKELLTVTFGGWICFGAILWLTMPVLNWVTDRVGLRKDRQAS